MGSNLTSGYLLLERRNPGFSREARANAARFEAAGPLGLEKGVGSIPVTHSINPDESVEAGPGSGLASYVFEVVHQSGEGLVEVFVATALQQRELHMFSEGP